jgi:hypothetical protein
MNEKVGSDVSMSSNMVSDAVPGLQEQNSMEVSSRVDPSNLGNTLSENTRKRLYQSQRSSMSMQGGEVIEARRTGQAGQRLTQDQINIDMQTIFPGKED